MQSRRGSSRGQIVQQKNRKIAEDREFSRKQKHDSGQKVYQRTGHNRGKKVQQRVGTKPKDININRGKGGISAEDREEYQPRTGMNNSRGQGEISTEDRKAYQQRTGRNINIGQGEVSAKG